MKKFKRPIRERIVAFVARVLQVTIKVRRETPDDYYFVTYDLNVVEKNEELVEDHCEEIYDLVGDAADK